MNIVTYFTETLSKNSILATCIVFILTNCARGNQNDSIDNHCSNIVSSIQNKDTLFLCKQTQIGNHIWMGENLCVKTFRNGDSIKKVDTIEKWRFNTDSQIPTCMEVCIDKNYYKKMIVSYTNNLLGVYGNYLKVPEYTNFYLYNQYAITDKRKLCPKGWRIPQKEDWQELFKFTKHDKYLLDTVGVVKSFNNKYGFSLRPTPFGFGAEPMTYDFEMSFAMFWTSKAGKVMLNTLYYDDEDDFNIPQNLRWQQSNLYDGCCVRCIKE